MEALEKAKLALRKHLLENKHKVASDLEAMRKLSKGMDVFSYMDKLSDAFSFEAVTTAKEVTYEYSFVDMDCYDLINAISQADLYSPPEILFNQKTKKDPEIESRSFFFNTITLC